MKIRAVQDAGTGRTERLILTAKTFPEERTLTLLHKALIAGRHVIIELSDDEDFEFSLDVDGGTN